MILDLSRAVRRAAPALLAGLALSVALSACGGAAGSDDGVVSLASPTAGPGASASPAASVDPEDAVQAFTDDALTTWIPPVLLDDYRYFSLHPLIPMLSQKDLEP